MIKYNYLLNIFYLKNNLKLINFINYRKILIISYYFLYMTYFFIKIFNLNILNEYIYLIKRRSFKNSNYF